MIDDLQWSEEDVVEMPTILIHVINELADLSHPTMRIVGKFKKRLIHILIDSGSTHNFLDMTLPRD